MALEAIAIILSLTAVAVLTVLVGRLLATMIKIAVVVAVVYFVYTRVDFKKTPLCHSKQVPQTVTQLLCR